MDRVTIKKRAKEFAFANKWNIWKAILLVSAINYATSFCLSTIANIIGLDTDGIIFSLVSFALVLAIMPLQVGFASYLIKLINGKEINITEELFARYKDGSMFKIIIVTFVAGLIIGAMSLLLVIPGIIFAIKYSMLSFVLAEQSLDDMNKEEAYKVSSRMMDGHKMEYFIFILSFLGWALLCCLTLGILYIWIVPYYYTANVMWYEELKKISK